MNRYRFFTRYKYIKMRNLSTDFRSPKIIEIDHSQISQVCSAGRMPRLIWVFSRCTLNFVGLVLSRRIVIQNNHHKKRQQLCYLTLHSYNGSADVLWRRIFWRLSILIVASIVVRGSAFRSLRLIWCLLSVDARGHLKEKISCKQHLSYVTAHLSFKITPCT